MAGPVEWNGMGMRSSATHLVPEEYLEAPEASDRSEEEGPEVRLPVVEEGESPHGSPAVVHDGLEGGEGDARVAESLPHEAHRIQRREGVGVHEHDAVASRGLGALVHLPRPLASPRADE